MLRPAHLPHTSIEPLAGAPLARTPPSYYNPPMFAHHLQNLASPDPTEQQTAGAALRAAGPAALPSLLAALQTSENDLLRIRVAALLGEIADPPTETLLISLLHDPNPRLRHTAIHALGRRPTPPAIQALTRIITSDPDLPCRQQALFWLAQTIDAPTFDSLFTLALYDPALRREAIWNIARLRRGGPPIVALLLQLLPTVDDQTLPMLIYALGLLRDPRAFEPLAAYLASPNPYHRGLAAQALGHLGDLRAIASLTPLLSDPAIAWTEDHGPDLSVAGLARQALHALTPSSTRTPP